MKYRKLRIAWSVTCGILCLLSIALWVRSYWAVDYVQGPLKVPRQFVVWSCNGRLTASLVAAEGAPKGRWGRGSLPNPLSEIDMYVLNARVAISAPFSLPTVLIGLTAAVPWLRWRRFSLRTLLIAMTLVAVGLGSIVLL